ncbi:MarR family winged helix-turn-helix transcriptional regulator [Actinomyces culturomici]|uniref:MarR family winged helix-turn-helix transcriptional regulator n=1 Tax=Actinomyces culturomici TaxID=1926276 RepID=UPI000E205C6B|nr:MarR family winged helix-turn-helix transcriptional regulator [Actinomyces culturomici]
MTSAPVLPIRHGEVLDSLVGAEIAVWNRLEHALWEIPDSATLGRLLTLRAIDAAGPHGAHVHEIASTQRITVGAASRLVDRLVADGLVDRLTCPQDRRASCLVLTDAGSARMTTAAGGVSDELSRLLSGFSAAEIDALVPLLRRLIASAEAADAARSPRPSANGRGRGRRMTRAEADRAEGSTDAASAVEGSATDPTSDGTPADPAQAGSAARGPSTASAGSTGGAR